MPDLTTRQDIDKLLADFYALAMADAGIGHFFTEVVALNLETHLPVIGNFWESVLLGQPVYRGNPMLIHLELAARAPLTTVHFERWLALWRQCVHTSFAGERATLAIDRAEQIARLMLLKIEQGH
ncbi:group III truncated hemoglobin [Neolewinella lacunae]|uniref:Group III truncated hemoglobin n=1 Tax=Neolewinella lacunae TaxID=1517758 RepID=A0A923PP09_9BACT|nr:group III truncated hemoglobin [Neolewinella lacunae]MBC6995945.1 group III truncated hemoglobin [Neolewinella lacunae]MDN3635211.1 group III truncated hemoglobin [Neolewinella lacunae]